MPALATLGERTPASAARQKRVKAMRNLAMILPFKEDNGRPFRSPVPLLGRASMIARSSQAACAKC